MESTFQLNKGVVGEYTGFCSGMVIQVTDVFRRKVVAYGIFLLENSVGVQLGILEPPYKQLVKGFYPYTSAFFVQMPEREGLEGLTCVLVDNHHVDAAVLICALYQQLGEAWLQKMYPHVEGTEFQGLLVRRGFMTDESFLERRILAIALGDHKELDDGIDLSAQCISLTGIKDPEILRRLSDNERLGPEIRDKARERLNERVVRMA